MITPRSASPQTPDPWPTGGGELGALVRQLDWAKTGLGPIADWSSSLKTAVTIVLNSPMPIVMLWGSDGVMIYNDAYSVFAGGRHPRLLGSPVLEGWPEVADFNRRVMEVGLGGGTLSFRDQHLVLHRHGAPEDVWMDLSYSPIPDETGTPAGVLAIVVETTERVLAERQIRTLNETLERQVHTLAELDRAKTIFFTNISHEFRTPLTLMLGPTEDALRSSAKALAGPALETVYRNELRLLKLVNALLDFSRIEAGRMRGAFALTDLTQLTTDLAVAFRPAVERAGLAFVVTCEPTEPVYVDREMWEKIVLNLLSNALKFTLRGRITLTLESAGEQVLLRVQDTGIGISAEDLPRLFTRFHRVEGAQARTQEGSGIGLALVDDLVRLHGGRVDIESAPGQGTTLTIRLRTGDAHLPPDQIARPETAPHAAVHANAFVEEAARWSATSPSPSPLPPSTGMPASFTPVAGHVLVADDNADMRDYLARVLQEHWSVETVADGAAALRATQARLPDVIVTDIMMPGLDGVGLLRALRAADATAHVPVVMVSARAGEEARIEGLHLGADDYLVKPFSARELVARVNAQLRLAHARREMILLRDAAESANRAKDEFLAMLGHELRNPLAPILTALHLLKLRGVDAAERERAIIERQVNHLVALVDDLLDVSRITRGKIELRLARVEAAEFVARGIELASPLLEQQRQNLTVNVPRSGLTVEGDAARLAQVVANLLTNAAKYSEPGAAIIVTGRADADDVEIRVRDSGIGIDAERLPFIFDMFVQEPQTIERSRGGLGLGLAIVRSLVSLHGGAVSVHSDGKGRGSEFVVRLPRMKGVVPGATATDPRLAAVKSSGAVARGRVLVVDDNRDAALTLADMLSAFGYITRPVHDGPSALRVGEDFQPDIALLDIGLPVMDGYELAHRFAEHPRLRHTRLVAITGYGQPQDRDRSAAAGFAAHLVKPVEIDNLRSVMAALSDSTPES